MKPLKPLFMKTYGRQIRKVSAWISPENRKQAFDSTRSTDGDISVFEPSEPTKIRKRKTSVSSRRVARPAKKKAMLCLIEKSFNEENIPSPTCSQPAQHNNTTREKKTSGSSSGTVHPSKRKAVPRLTESSSDEENISRPSPPQHPQQKKTNRKSRLVPVSGVLMRRKGQKVPRTSEREDSTSSTKCQKNSVQMKTDSTVHLPSTGRFVTHRRRAVTAKPKLPKAMLSILNSSDDFTSGASGSSRIVWPSKRRRKRRPPQAFVVSSAENSVNAAGTASFATNPFQEISLNGLADHSVGPCPRKPMFCSTPSAGPFSKRPYLKPLPINDQSPPSMSLSCIGVLSTFQEDLDSSGQAVFTPCSAPPTGLHSEEKPQSSFGEASADLFMEAKSSSERTSCSEEAKSHSEDIKTKNPGGLPIQNLISTDDSERSSHFVSAVGGLEWLIQALKEKCLTEHCTVQLERLCGVTVTQPCSQTTYSSCLEHSSSDQTNEHPLSVHSVQTSDPSFHLNLSVTNNKTSGYLQSINSESCEHAASVTDSLCSNSVVDSKHSAEHSSSKEPVEQSASPLHVQSTPHTDSSTEFIMGTQLPGNSPLQALFTEEEALSVKEKCLTQKCTVPLQKWALSQMTVHLKGSLQQKEEGLSCSEKSDLPDAKSSESNHTHNTDDPEDLTRSVEIPERTMASVQQPVNSSSSVAEVRYDDPEKEKRAAGPTAMLKEKCLTDQFIVEVKRLTLSQLKEFRQLKDRKLKLPADTSDSDDQTTSHRQSESGTNHSNAATKVMKKRGATRSEDKEVVNNNSHVPHKRKKSSLAPKEKKRKSMSMERSGTSRKACVSGLSVSRWKNKDCASTHLFRSRTAQMGGNRTVDCSISEFISTQHKQPRELLGTTMNFSTPVRVSPLNISSLLADVTPNTHTWSRLKAALSVHRKGIVLCTPRRSGPRQSGSPRRAELADLSQDLFATPFRSLLPKGLRSQLLSCSSQVECEDSDLSDAEKVYAECGQQRPLPWEECIPPQRMKRCVKIGEGTFGEVFSTINASGETVALKIIPIEGSEQVNGEDQKTFGEILHEIIISKELSSLKEKQQNQTHGFIGLNDLHCVQGCYPPDFLKAWDAFNQQKSSENDRPDFFQKDQLFIILEFEFGGIDLENSNGTLTSLGVAKSILHQVTAALAVAEQELHFEHRDLHWGNVLVKPTKEKRGSFLLKGAAHSLETKGVLVRIIDYSLSRLEIDDLTVSCDISKDEELFMGQGDYQFDIYRLMRQENGNNWSNYHPHTNVLWLHYLCSKLLSMKYRGSGGRGAKDMREALTRFYDNVLQYKSATEALKNCPMFQ